jgi:nucleoside-diphosphate-sugar epimerase
MSAPAGQPQAMQSAQLSAITSLLVTGAPGWLADALLTQIGREHPNAKLRCFVQNSLPQDRFKTWRQQHPEVREASAGDMLDHGSFEAACAGLAGGAVLHSAGVIHPRRTSDWYAVNRDGTLALARAAKAAGVKRFVFISSNAAQGAQPSRGVLLTEEMPCRPVSHYGRSKHEAEQGLLALHDAKSFEVVIVRPCMFYGPPVPERHIDIFKRIRDGRLPLVGGGDYTRSLSYIDDLVAGIVLCLTHPAASGQIFNLCDTKVHTTRDVCEAMAAALGVKPRYIRLPGFSASIAYTVDRALAAFGVYSMNFHLLGEANWNVGNSNEKARRVLGFAPKVDLQEGYRRAVEWAREQKQM